MHIFRKAFYQWTKELCRIPASRRYFHENSNSYNGIAKTMGVFTAEILPTIEGSSNKVLVIARQETVQAVVRAEVVKLPGLSILSCSSEEQYHEVIAQNSSEIIIAIADVSTCGTAIIEDLSKYGIPTVGLFNRVDDCPRISGKHVVSNIDRDDIDQMAGLSAVVEGIFENRKTRIVILHQDSKYRKYLEEILLGRYFTVMQASDVAQAMELLTLYPNTQVLLLDENYRQVGNIEVINLLRRNYPADNLSIISLITQRDAALVSALFESGSSDVVATSTDDVEFLARVQQQASVILNFRIFKNRVFKDPLTEAYTMDYLWDVGPKLFANASRDSFKLALAVINIDNFTEVNDEYGAAVGDLVLRSVTEQLNSIFRTTDFVVRKEGDEFISLLSCVDRDKLAHILERTREQIESGGVWFGKTKLPITITIGATVELGASLINMLTRAEVALVQARKTGRNRIEIL